MILALIFVQYHQNLSLRSKDTDLTQSYVTLITKNAIILRSFKEVVILKDRLNSVKDSMKQ